ncbi:MAG: type II toxin-antitoxin system VapC family toxin [Candidatus Saccharimonadales bacterium]
MKLLLDTNVLLWLAAGNLRITQDFLHTLDEAEKVFVSDISLLEISIKISVGKLLRPHRFAEALQKLGTEKLPIDNSALDILEGLPLLHRDPFDRTLVAQAIAENATLVTGDKQLTEYDVKSILV